MIVITVVLSFNVMSSNKVTSIEIPPDKNPQAHEDEHVHAVYEQIASHFSSTRYKVSAVPHEKPTHSQNKSLGLS